MGVILTTYKSWDDPPSNTQSLIPNPLGPTTKNLGFWGSTERGVLGDPTTLPEKPILVHPEPMSMTTLLESTSPTSPKSKEAKKCRGGVAVVKEMMDVFLMRLMGNIFECWLDDYSDLHSGFGNTYCNPYTQEQFLNQHKRNRVILKQAKAGDCFSTNFPITESFMIVESNHL